MIHHSDGSDFSIRYKWESWKTSISIKRKRLYEEDAGSGQSSYDVGIYG